MPTFPSTFFGGSGPVRRNGATNSGNSSTVSATLPPGWQSGDLVCVLVYAGGNPTITPPAGWTRVATQKATTYTTASVFYRVMQAGDTDPSFSLSASAAWKTNSEAFYGVNQTTPINDGIGKPNMASSTVTCQGLTTSGYSLLLLFVSQFASNPTFSAPAGWNAGSYIADGAGGSKAFWKLDSGSNPPSVGVTSSVSGENIGWQVAINSA